MKYGLLFLVVFFFSMSSCYSQLSDFKLQVDIFNETCLGNGKLVISVSDTTAGAQLTYFTYKLSDLAIPISTSSSIDGLSAGNFKVVVTQTLDGVTNTQQKDVVILNKIQNLTYSLSHTLNECKTATLTVNVLTGDVSSYEIIKGPKVFPKQSTNIFSDLESGLYRVKISDDCENSDVQDYMIPETGVIKIDISDNYIDDCDSITLINKLTPNLNYKLNYPLNITYTIYPPNGADKYTINKIISSGSPDTLDLNLKLSLAENPNFQYLLSFIDNCGREFKTEYIIDINPSPSVHISQNQGKCNALFFNLNISQFSSPFTVKFTNTPPGFNPADYNASHPGPFNQGKITYGSVDNPVPEGLYVVEILDTCGRKGVSVEYIKSKDEKALFSTENNGCDSLSGSIYMYITGNRKIVSSIMTVAPVNYPLTLPSDVSSMIDKGTLNLTNVPVGTYEVTIVDECGIKYFVKDIEVPFAVKHPPTCKVVPGCTEGFGSIQIIFPPNNSKTVIMTAAPTNFGQAIPYDVSSFVVDGKLSMANLPAGDYEFVSTDHCGDAEKISIPVHGFHQGMWYKVIRNCGSFQVEIMDQNIVDPKNEPDYWLQKLNPLTSVWEHPYTGVDYSQGSPLNNTNSLYIGYNTTAFNIAVKGDFRIIKTYKSFANAELSSGYVDCIIVLGEFNFSDDLKILGAYNLDCSGGPGASTIILDIEGAPPYSCKIIQKDGAPFLVDNGTNNVFSNLEVGTYDFQVGDSCGKLRTGKYAVGSLPKLVQANKPGNMLICGDVDKEAYIFDLTKQITSILGNQSLNKYMVTFYLNSDDAENDVNQIDVPSLFLKTINPQTIYARVINKEIDLCHDVTSFQILEGITPVLSAIPDIFLCQGSSKVIQTNNGFDAYQWSTGAKTSSIEVTQSGAYSVTVKNLYDDLSCDTTDNIVVTSSGIATIEAVEINDWTSDSNSVMIVVSGIGDYEYSLDNMKFQAENLFVNLRPGSYTIYIRDKNGCGTVSKEVVLLNYRKFFTPNGDGVNEKWRIAFSDLEPELITQIFNRYGKLLTVFDTKSAGWDGTYNGEKMPADDYWFVVERADGKVYKGHFSLKR